MTRHDEQGLGLVELVIGLAITSMIAGTLGLAVVATLRNSAAASDQQQATEQLRNGLFWLNQDTQSGVASLATLAAGDVTMQWTDYSTGQAYSSRFQQAGSELRRTLTVDGTPTTRTIARGVVPGGFSAVQSGNAVAYTLTVANGSSTQSAAETTVMRVSGLPSTPFATITASPTPTWTSTPTSTSTTTPTATPTPGCTGPGDTGYRNPSANAADTGGWGDGFETNPTGGYASGGTDAESALTIGDRHRYYNYGISVPAGCVVNGIEVRLDWWLSQIWFFGSSMSIDLSWDGGNTWTSAQTDTTQTTALHTFLLGGATDAWGRTWSAADLSDANFRLRVTMNGGFLSTFYLDWVPIKVYYSQSTPTPTSTSTPTFTPTPTSTPTFTPTVTPTFTPTPSCVAGNTGYLNPTADTPDTGGDGDGFEDNPWAAYADGGPFATNAGGDGDRHRYSDYGISIPAGCNTISGIVVRLDYWLKNTGGTNTISVALSWNGGSSWTASSSDSSEPTSQTSVLFGSSSDTWGRAWTTSNLSNANFRVRVTMTLGNGGQQVYLDWVPVKVYYAP